MIKKIIKKIIFKIIRANYPYQMEGLITCHNVDFLKDSRFLDAYALAYEIDRGKNFTSGNWYEDEQIGAYLIYTTQYFALHASKLSGDFVECGTWRGRHAISILKYLELSNVNFDKNFYLFDTFQGLSAEVSEKSEVAHYNKIYNENVLEEVKCRFKNYRNVMIVPGVLPKTLESQNIKDISLLLIDLNSAAAEIACLEILFDKVQKGGVIIFDDYGQTGHIKQKNLIDQFLFGRGYSVYACPTRQGILIK